jgi:hypothetical protein
MTSEKVPLARPNTGGRYCIRTSDLFRVRANLCLEKHASVAPGARGGSLMSATVRAGWPTVRPTANGGALSRRKRSCLGRRALHAGATSAQVFLND